MYVCMGDDGEPPTGPRGMHETQYTWNDPDLHERVQVLWSDSRGEFNALPDDVRTSLSNYIKFRIGPVALAL